MKKQKLMHYLVLVILVLAGSVTAGENLLRDMNFTKLNTKETNWENYCEGKGLIRKNISVEGKKALLIDSTGDAGGVMQAIENIEPTKFYRAEVFAKKLTLKSTEGVFFQLRFLLPNKKSKVFQIPLNPKSEQDFEKFVVEAEAPEDTIRAQFFIYIQRDKNAAIITTDVTLEKIDSKLVNIVTESVSYKRLPECPKIIPEKWLSPEEHPRVFCSKEELNNARHIAVKTNYGKSYLETQKKLCQQIINMSDEQLRALVPKPGSLIVYGLGMNLCPQGQRLRWAGIEKPFTVYGKNNIAYPNENFPDNGSGWIDKESGNKFLFIANANGFIHKYLEQEILPALADVYALSGNKKYAHTAAVLLDAIAVAYFQNRRGPLDYPTNSNEYDRGGRLDRPYYQTARGLYNYVNTIDLITSSGELGEKSLSSKEKTIRENIIRNLLWDGALYCLDFTLERGKHPLLNGHADYMRGAGMVGIMLNQRDFAEPMLKGELSIAYMLDNNIDRNGFYIEISPTYCVHTSQLYHVIAELFKAAKDLNWKDIKPIYNSQVLANFLSEFFNRGEVGGHVPAIGDDGPDIYFNSPLRRQPSKTRDLSNRYLENQINNAWIMLVRSDCLKQRSRAATVLKNTFGNETIVPPDNRWAIYHINQEHIAMIEKIKEDPAFFNSNSVFYGAKGLALLRGGEGEKRFGCQLLFGPQNSHGQKEMLSWTFFDRGAEWSYDPGYFNTHYLYGWANQSVAHQMVTVNAESCADGSGFMTAWLDTPAVQWTFAKHPDAYNKQDMKRYERFIAQVVNPDNGRLGYWLDVSRVEGGKFRDDSFHTAMTDAEVSTELRPMKEFSLYGDMYKDCSFLNDYRLDKFKEKPFFWHPPGDGYGFLAHPRQIIMSGPIHMIFSNPGFKSLGNSNTAIAVDFPGKLGRDLIMANSFAARGAPSVPYVIRRDSGSAPSVFAKVIRTFDKDATDHIVKVENVKIEKGPAIARAYLITWRNGLSDLWIISENGTNVTVAPENLPKVHCDGLVAMVRFDRTGKTILMNASTASMLEVDGQNKIAGTAEARGQIENISDVGDNVAFKMNWFGLKPFIPSGTPLITKTKNGTPATWRIATADDNNIKIEGVKTIIGTSTFTPCAQRPGWYSLMPFIGRLYGLDSKGNKNLVIGKAVYDNEKRIVGLITDATKYEVKLENAGAPAIREKFTGQVFEAIAGDEFTIPLNLHWEEK